MNQPSVGHRTKPRSERLKLVSYRLNPGSYRLGQQLLGLILGSYRLKPRSGRIELASVRMRQGSQRMQLGCLSLKPVLLGIQLTPIRIAVSLIKN